MINDGIDPNKPCAIFNCEKKAFIFFNHLLVCGDHVIKLDKLYKEEKKRQTMVLVERLANGN